LTLEEKEFSTVNLYSGVNHFPDLIGAQARSATIEIGRGVSLSFSFVVSFPCSLPIIAATHQPKAVFLNDIDREDASSMVTAGATARHHGWE